MKFLGICGCLFLCQGFAAASQEQPQHVRVCAQYLSLPHAVLTDLLAGEVGGNNSLHERAFAFTKDGRAKLIESCLIVCRSREKATVESVREEIYPTEYEPPEFPSDGTQSFMPFPSFMPFTRAYPAFEVRHVGTTLEVSATVMSNDLIDLMVVPEVLHHLRLETWMEHSDPWGTADIRWPIFETWRTRTTIGLKPGTFVPIAVFSPRRTLPVPFEDARVLLFGRADLVEIDGDE